MHPWIPDTPLNKPACGKKVEVSQGAKIQGPRTDVPFSHDPTMWQWKFAGGFCRRTKAAIGGFWNLQEIFLWDVEKQRFHRDHKIPCQNVGGYGNLPTHNNDSYWPFGIHQVNWGFSIAILKCIQLGSVSAFMGVFSSAKLVPRPKSSRHVLGTATTSPRRKLSLEKSVDLQVI